MTKIIKSTSLLLAFISTLTACGGGGDGDGGTGNTAPVAYVQTLYVTQDTPVSIQLEGSDVDGDALIFVNSIPTNGTLTGTAPSLTYTPTTGYEGNDSFDFTVNDGTTDSAPATISIVVSATPQNNAPTAYSQSVTTVEDTGVAITLTGHDPDGDSLNYNTVTAPANGTLSGTAPNLIYTPTAGYTGNDSFTFTANDGTIDSAVATVSIAINAATVNSAPTANAQSVTTDEDVALAITLSGNDPDGDTLTYTVNAPANGTITGTAPNLTYTPDPHYNGSDSFTFTVNDGNLDSNTATISISINPQPDPNPIADSQNVSTNEDTPVAITLTGFHPDGNAIVSYTVMSSPVNGSLSGIAPDLTYTPNANYNGTDAFNFIVSDGTTDSPVSTIFININPLNDAPVASNAVFSVTPGNTINRSLTASDLDGNNLIYTIVAAPSNGTVTLTDANTGAFTYTLNVGFTSDSFTFKVTDDDFSLPLDSNTATVTINSSIAAPPSSGLQAIPGDQRVTLNWDPVAGADSYTVYWSNTPGTGTAGTAITNIQPPFIIMMMVPVL